MSVILEGKVSTESDIFVWEGLWQFSKEKKTNLSFSYKWTSDTVSEELLDYVSFKNEITLIPASKKIKLKGGRKNALVSSPNELLESVYHENHNASSTHGINGTIVDMAATESSVDVVETEQMPSLAVIDRSRQPMLGVWEGHFNIKSPKTVDGADEPVSEVFFFHTLLNGPGGQPASISSSAFSDLPPEPQFPYGLLRHTDLPPATSLSVPSLQDIPSSSNSSATESSGADAVLSHSSIVSAPDTSVNSSTNFVVLAGFGRNMFGRFSVAGLYDEQSGELRCEKKYLVSKFAAKRGRKSHAETATSGQYEGVDCTVKFNTTTRHKTAASSYDGADGESSAKRKRAASSLMLSPSDTSVLLKDAASSKAASSSSSSLQGSAHVKQYGGTRSENAAAHVLATSGGYALVGPRHPDSDDPLCEYREAFQDCDSGEVYEGGWAVGGRSGRGVCLFNDGLMYEGNWLQNKQHGKGQLMTADRQLIYSGDWLDGCFHGYGTYYYGNGDRYIGDWRESHRQGKGDYLFKNGCRYSGDWRDNKRAGRGVFTWPDGSLYDGDWEADRRHGRGVLELAGGFQYDGGWTANLMDGKGCCTFPSGQVYQGNYKSGLREGRGSVLFAEGAVYEGRFKDDRLDGQGTIKVTNNVPGNADEGEELMVPVQIQAELWRIHLKAGFGASDGH